jgi:hypothetical protein
MQTDIMIPNFSVVAYIYIMHQRHHMPLENPVHRLGANLLGGNLGADCTPNHVHRDYVSP